MLTRPIAARMPSISVLRLNMTTLYNVEANGSSDVTTFGLRPLIPIRLAFLDLCYQNQISTSFPLLMKPSGVALASPRLQPGQAWSTESFGSFVSSFDVAVLLKVAADPLSGM